MTNIKKHFLLLYLPNNVRLSKTLSVVFPFHCMLFSSVCLSKSAKRKNSLRIHVNTQTHTHMVRLPQPSTPYTWVNDCGQVDSTILCTGTPTQWIYCCTRLINFKD